MISVGGLFWPRQPYLLLATTAYLGYSDQDHAHKSIAIAAVIAVRRC